MLDFLFSGWGAFWVTMAMLLPFAGMFWYVIHRKSVVDSGPGTTPPATMSRLEGYWLTAVFVIFVTINLASLRFSIKSRSGQPGHYYMINRRPRRNQGRRDP